MITSARIYALRELDGMQRLTALRSRVRFVGTQATVPMRAEPAADDRFV